MRKISQTAVAFAVAFAAALGGVNTAHANVINNAASTAYFEQGEVTALDNFETFGLEIDLNDLDLTQPFTMTQQFINADGEPVTIEYSFTPALQTRWSSTYTAAVGTWTFSYNSIASMSFQVDMERSGSQWKLSNARNHTYSAPFTTFSDAKLSISRAVSTSTFPAEVNASVVAKVFDNQWFALYTITAWFTVTVSSSGVVTFSGN